MGLDDHFVCDACFIYYSYGYTKEACEKALRIGCIKFKVDNLRYLELKAQEREKVV